MNGKFKIKAKLKHNSARSGVLETKHGKLITPFFMPVATRGVLKMLSTEDIKKLNTGIVLSNTYHLMLRPGEKHVKKMGGLHKFMAWPGAILTDSGGFQIFSLAGQKREGSKNLVKLSESGVKFSSHIDGKLFELTPESSFDIQRQLGVDIAVCLDECVALPAKREYVEESVELTSAWAARAKKQQTKTKGDKPLLFAVVQGGLEKDLRLKSLSQLTAIGFDGYNIGGLSVGETPAEMYAVLDYLMPAMPADKPRYLMGVGYPDNIVEAVKRGVDMFDCVIPSREGRHGKLFLFKKGWEKKLATALKDKKISACDFYESVNVKNLKFKENKKPINEKSAYGELRDLSFGYLNYLFKIDELLAQRLATMNNLEFYLNLMSEIRKIIQAG